MFSRFISPSIIFLLLATVLYFPPRIYGKTNSFVNIVNPIRGNEFWDDSNQKPIDTVLSQTQLLDEHKLPATWLIRFDALAEAEITSLVKKRPLDEKGVFIEITPLLAQAAGVDYKNSESWHFARSLFLTGYTVDDRKKIIDVLFEKHRLVFGAYPQSVGAWWIDATSLIYMWEKYSIEAALVVADQYSTDDYQIRGQYWSAPYYPYRRNALFPAQSIEQKIPVVIIQWASRDPINGYGKGVEESTYSVQVNDYLDYHDLGNEYFDKLIDIYTIQPLNKFGHVVIGLENSYSWKKYQSGFTKQLVSITAKKNQEQFRVVTMREFAGWYKEAFPTITPEMVIMADDPLGSGHKAIWFMNPFYRAGLIYDQQGFAFRDIRSYTEGVEEPCLLKACETLTFITLPGRVIDEVMLGHRWTVDEGQISNFQVSKDTDHTSITYSNTAGKTRKIELLSRDISLDGTISSIDQTILQSTKFVPEKKELDKDIITSHLVTLENLVNLFKNLIIFGVFLMLAVFIPGYIILGKKEQHTFTRIFLSLVLGMLLLALVFYCSKLLNLNFLIYLYSVVSLIFFLHSRLYKNFIPIRFSFNWLYILVIMGSLFQATPFLKSNSILSFGIGFWSQNIRDGMWNIAVVNQLLATVPAINPIFSGELLRGFPVVYQSLVAGTHLLSTLDTSDLIFELYPFLFCILLGFAAITIVENYITVTRKFLACSIVLYFIYFGSSFGWVIEIIKGGNLLTSRFSEYSNILSYNFYPSTLLSLFIIVAIIHVISKYSKPNWLLFVTGSIFIAGLIGLGSMVVLAPLIIVSFWEIVKYRKFSISLINLAGICFGSIVFLSGNITNLSFEWRPFSLIHDFVDSPDKLGWPRFTAAREAYVVRHEWVKWIVAEVSSFLIFIFGNLGVRSLGFIKFTRGAKEFKSSSLLLFILSLIGTSVFVPIFFLNRNTSEITNIFLFYCVFFTSVLAGVVLTGVINGKLLFVRKTIFLTVLILVPIGNIAVAKDYFSYKPYTYISSSEIEALNFLRGQKGGVVLTYPYSDKIREKITEPLPLFAYETTAYVSSYTSKPIYMVDEVQNETIKTDYSTRRILAKSFFEHSTPAGRSFLVRNNISYLYLHKYFNFNVDEDKAGIQKIFENKDILIYKTIKD